MESKYQIVERENGFDILGRVKTSVDFDGYLFHVGGPDFLYSSSYRICECYSMQACIIHNIMKDWKPKDTTHRCARPKITSWAMKNTGKALAKKIQQQRLRLLSNADPRFVSLEKKIFGLYGKMNPQDNFLHSETVKVYKLLLTDEYQYLYRDMMQYRAATMMFPLLASLNNRLFLYKNTVCMSYDIDFSLDPINWMDWWAPFYDKNHAVPKVKRKIIMNLPGRLHFHALTRIKNCEFSRPITNRIELISYIEARDRHKSIVSKASEKDIRAAINYLKDKELPEYNSEYNFRKYYSIASAISYITDYPEDYHGDIVGLAKRSFKYHENLYRDNANEIVKSYNIDLDTKTIPPPIDIPQTSGITFLKTAGEIIERARSQQHCVDSYVGYAIDGTYYFFSINYKDNQATAQIDNYGNLIQIKGPKNTENAACNYGRKIFREWKEQWIKNLESNSQYKKQLN